MIATDNERRNTCDDDICDNGTGDERQNTCDDATDDGRQNTCDDDTYDEKQNTCDEATDDERQNACDDAKSDERQNTCDNATDDERQNHHLQHSHVHFPRQACQRKKKKIIHGNISPVFLFLKQCRPGPCKAMHLHTT